MEFADSFLRTPNSRMDTLGREKGNEREGNFAMNLFSPRGTGKCVKCATNQRVSVGSLVIFSIESLIGSSDFSFSPQFPLD